MGNKSLDLAGFEAPRAVAIIRPVTVAPGEVADMRSALTALRDAGAVESQRDRTHLALHLVIGLSIIAGEALARSNDRAASALGIELLDWMAQDGEAEATFGFRRRGGVSPERAAAIAERDELLLRLAHLDGMLWAPLPPGPAARAMLLSFDRYETSRWTRERDAIGAPPLEPAATWWRILHSGVGMPRSKRLGQILAREIQ